PADQGCDKTILWEQTRNDTRRNKRGDYTGNQRAKESKRDAFKNQRKERKPKILPAERKPSHSLDWTAAMCAVALKELPCHLKDQPTKQIKRIRQPERL